MAAPTALRIVEGSSMDKSKALSAARRESLIGPLEKWADAWALGWVEAADLIISSMEKSILSKKVTYDFARLLEGATQVSCSGFGQVMIDNM